MNQQFLIEIIPAILLTSKIYDLDVVVMNSHSSFQSTGIGYGGAIPGSVTLGAGVMNRRGISQRIGDLVFVLEDK